MHGRNFYLAWNPSYSFVILSEVKNLGLRPGRQSSPVVQGGEAEEAA